MLEVEDHRLLVGVEHHQRIGLDVALAAPHHIALGRLDLEDAGPHEAEQEAAVGPVVDLAEVPSRGLFMAVVMARRDYRLCSLQHKRNSVIAATSSSPLPVEPAVLNRLGDVGGRDALITLQVGDRARHAEHAVVAARRQPEPAHGRREQAFGFGRR